MTQSVSGEDFDAMEAIVADGDMAQSLACLASILEERGRTHELFEARKLQLRHELGLPLLSLDPSKEWSGVDESVQQRYEAGLLIACREVGDRLLAGGKLRDAWTYLRALGDTQGLANRLRAIEIDESQCEEFIEITFHEGVDPELGFATMLRHFGTCNSITTLNGYFSSLPKPAQQSTATILLRHIHDELTSGMRAHVVRLTQEDSIGGSPSISTLMKDYPQIFDDGAHHIDVSHLAAALRLARVIDEPNALRFAADIAEYGTRLDKVHHYPGEEPFVDVFASHALYFDALLGQQQDEAIDYFRERADQVDSHYQGTLAIEVYVELLDRLGRTQTAIEESLKRLPVGSHTTGTAPSLLELSRHADDYRAYLAQTRAKGDLLAFAFGLLERRKKGPTMDDGQ